jgi:hypothetical protein
LECIAIDKGLLDWMKFTIPGQAFDRCYFASLCRGRQNQAAVHPPPIEVHGASAALAKVAALLGPCQLQTLTQEIEQGGSRINLRLMEAAIDAECNLQVRTEFHVLRLLDPDPGIRRRVASPGKGTMRVDGSFCARSYKTCTDCSYQSPLSDAQRLANGEAANHLAKLYGVSRATIYRACLQE